MKSEVFNGPRFWTYFKYDLVQMWRNHIRASIGIGLSGLIFYVITVGFRLIFNGYWGGPGLATRLGIFVLAATALELYQTRTYGYLTDRRKGSAWLMNPASTFEKWLSMILMTLVVIPLLFLGVYALTDLVIAAFDPTVGESMVHAVGNGFRELTQGLVGVNETYQTSWSVWAFVPAFLAGFCCNFLFFLLCGLVFKKHKILGGFVIIFVLSFVFSLVMSALSLESLAEAEDLAQAEMQVRSIFNTTGWVAALIAAGLAGGIFYRLKSLTH